MDENTLLITDIEKENTYRIGFEEIKDYHIEEHTHKYYNREIPKFRYGLIGRFLHKLNIDKYRPFRKLDNQDNWSELTLYNFAILLKGEEKELMIYSPYESIEKLDKLGNLYERASKSNLYEKGQKEFKEGFKELGEKFHAIKNNMINNNIYLLREDQDIIEVVNRLKKYWSVNK